MVNALPIIGLAAVIIGTVGVYGGGGPPVPRDFFGEKIDSDSPYYNICYSSAKFNRDNYCYKSGNTVEDNYACVHTHEPDPYTSRPITGYNYSFQGKFDDGNARMNLKYLPYGIWDTNIPVRGPGIGPEKSPSINIHFSGTDLELMYCGWGMHHWYRLTYGNVQDPTSIEGIGATWLSNGNEDDMVEFIVFACRRADYAQNLAAHLAMYMEKEMGIIHDASAYASNLVYNILCGIESQEFVRDNEVQDMMSHFALKQGNGGVVHMTFEDIYRAMHTKFPVLDTDPQFVLSSIPIKPVSDKVQISLLRCYENTFPTGNGRLCTEYWDLPLTMMRIGNRVYQEYYSPLELANRFNRL